MILASSIEAKQSMKYASKVNASGEDRGCQSHSVAVGSVEVKGLCKGP